MGLILKGWRAGILTFRGGGPPKVVEGRAKPRRALPYFMTMRRTGRLHDMCTLPTDNSRETAAADWLQVNREAMIASTEWVEDHGLPLRDHRLL